MLFSTGLLILGAIVASLTIPEQEPEIQQYRHAAYVMGGFLLAALACEATAGLKALIRVDLVALIGLYFLTFAEFLAPETRILYNRQTGMAAYACNLVAVGMAFLAIGRHFPIRVKGRLVRPRLPDIGANSLFQLFLFLFALGYAYLFISVNFNIFQIFESALQPRFMRPWQRGAIGGISSVLTELQLLLYPLAAVGGYLLARRSEIGLSRTIICIFLITFMLFIDITDGARNVFLIKGAIFTGTYLFAAKKITNMKIFVFGCFSISIILIISVFTLNIRGEGLRRSIAEGQFQVANEEGFMLDNNLISIARVSSVYPYPYPYPGSDIVIQIFTKWVPRAIWPGKPVEWENSIERALGTGGGYTLAVTSVGEAYLISGLPSLIFVMLVMGSIFSTWNLVAYYARSNLDLIYYGAGFYVAMLGVRSIQFITIAIVPLVAFFIISKILFGSRS